MDNLPEPGYCSLVELRAKAERHDAGRLRTALGLLAGTSAIACVAAPFGVVGQRNAPRPPALAMVTHTPPAVQEVAVVAPPATSEPALPQAHAFRVGDLATDARYTLVTGTVGKRPFLAALGASGMSAKEAHRVVAAFTTAGLASRVNRPDPGDVFTYAKTQDGRTFAFELVPSGAMERPSFDFFLATERDEGALQAERVSVPIERRQLTVGLAIADDLRAALASADLHEAIATRLDDALDGHAELSDLHAGARLRIVATEERLEGAFVSYAPIDAVEYTAAPTNGAQKPALRVYWFGKGSTETRHGITRGGFYDGDGRQPFHGAWRSPIPMARISSRFNPNRMHPVLHVVMPHNGVDFAAPAGTPVYAAASGVVRSVGDGGACGNMVQIDHPNGLTSAYCHLSKFGPIMAGEHVETRQLVGYVGQTGRATGPHLHFAVKRGDAFLDPLTMKLDGVRVVPPRLRTEFEQQRKALDALLDPIPLPASPSSQAHEDHEDETE